MAMHMIKKVKSFMMFIFVFALASVMISPLVYDASNLKESMRDETPGVLIERHGPLMKLCQTNNGVTSVEAHPEHGLPEYIYDDNGVKTPCDTTLLDPMPVNN